MKTKIYVKKRRRSYNENIPSTAVARYEYLFDVCQLFFSDQQPNVQCCIFFFTQHNIWTEIWKHIDSRNNFRNLFSKFSILHEILQDIITDHSSEMRGSPLRTTTVPSHPIPSPPAPSCGTAGPPWGSWGPAWRACAVRTWGTWWAAPAGSCTRTRRETSTHRQGTLL